MDNLWNSASEQWLQQRSTELGFELTGIAPADDLAEALDGERFEAWIDAGRAGEMDYLKRRDEAGRLLRSSIRTAHPWANSVIVCAMNYNTPAPASIATAPAGTGWIARYAQLGQPGTLAPTDYHDFLLNRLQQLAHELGERVGGASKCYVDTGPLVERSLAARAGIGWIGKNTCVLNQAEGSWLLLGCILSDLRLPQALASLPAADRCGSCTRCLDACPTGALTAPHQMDASLCIAYLTIEKKGPIPVDLRAPMGRQVFGCDICQDVCPWNRRAAIEPKPRNPSRRELVNPDLGWLAGMDAATFKHWFKGSPLERTRRARLHRNVAIAMGNSGEPGFLAQLEGWAAGDDPVLAEAAAWAIEQIQARIPRQNPAGQPGPGAPQLAFTP